MRVHTSYTDRTVNRWTLGGGRLVAAMSALLFFYVWLGFAPAIGAQQVPARPSFESSVDIVSVDVHVLDRNGRPVRDLEARDFTLSVDGHARKIASAQFVSASAPDVPIAPPPADYTTNVGAATGRLIVVIVDRGSIQPVRAKDVLTAAARFVGRLQPADRVALFSIPSGPAVDFTTDHESVVSALQRTDGQAPPPAGVRNIGVADALGFERGNGITIQDVVTRECGVMPERQGSEFAMCRKLVTEEARTVAAFAHESARNTIAGLHTILDRLGTSETPKTLLLISEGLVIDDDRYATSRLARALEAAHATIYALKPEPSDSDASQTRVPQNRSRDRAVTEEGLSAVTRAGGGTLIRVIADPDFAFDRLASEISGYYLLGFEPDPADRDGKQHAITVKVQRGDVAVRSRLEFTIGAAAHRTAQQTIAELLRAPVVATELPFKLTTYAFQDPESSKIRMLVAMEVERSDVSGQMALGIVLVKPGGDVATTFFQPSIDAPTQISGKPQRCFATLLVDPGQYTLRAAVLDGSGRRGSVERPVRAYMTRMARFRATELLIGDDAESQPAAGGVVPTVTGDLAGGQLHVYLELFSDAPDGFEGTGVTIEIIPDGGSTPVEIVPASMQPTGNDPRNRAAAGSIPIGLLPKGNYLARAVVTLDGRRVGQMTRPFRVVKP
jgi:VWFA-related protein